MEGSEAMEIVGRGARFLPRSIRTVLRPLYRRLRDIWEPPVVLDTQLIRETMEYFDLTYDEVLCMFKLRTKLNEILWTILDPKTDDEVRRFYEVTPFYACGSAYWHMERYQRKFRDELTKMVCGDVVDYGGGIGDISIKLAKKGVRVTYADVHGKTFDFAKWLFKKRGLDIPMIDLSEESLSKQYDAIVCIDVIEHVPMPEVALRTMGEHLKENGKLIITYPDAQHSSNQSRPMHKAMQCNVEELLNSLGLFNTGRKWLWVKKPRGSVQEDV